MWRDGRVNGSGWRGGDVWVEGGGEGMRGVRESKCGCGDGRRRGASSLNLPGAGFRVISKALTPGGGSALHSAVLKPATDSNWVRSGA